MKQKLVFDVTSVDTIADSDSVGAFLRSADGTLLTHTTVGGKQALDVRVAEGINVEVDLDHTQDSIRLGDGTDLFTSTTEGLKIGLDVNIINPSLVVTATDLDIRDLDAAQDSVQSWLHDGAGTAVTSTLEGTKQALDVFVANEIQVGDAALANVAIQASAISTASANVAQDVVASPLADRKYLFVANNSNRQVYVGQTGVTAATGFPLPPSAVLQLRAGAAVDIEVVSPVAGSDIRSLELA